MDGSSVNVPAFLTKLWKLVEDPNYDNLIHWSQNGKSFVISNQAQFAKELLPLYFKHNNMASFIRQLNMYGFRKITSIENSGLRAERDDIEFYHAHFVKDQEASLELIKRKIKTPLQVSAAKSIDENEVRHDDVGSILVDVKAIKGKQDTVDNILVKMQKENEALWREIAILRQQYQKQQHIVEKLLQFLLSIVQQRGIGVKRKSPLMIGLDETGDTESEFSKSKRPAKESDEQTINTLEKFGPTIFDVSDDFIEAELEAAANNCPIIAAEELSPLTVYNTDNLTDNILVTNQLDSTDTVDNFFDPLQSVIDQTMMMTSSPSSSSSNTNNNITNIESVQQLNTDSSLNNPSVSTSNMISNTELSQLTSAHHPESLVENILDSNHHQHQHQHQHHHHHQIDDTDTDVESLFDPLQSVIDQTLMTSNNLTNTDMESVQQQLNTDSSLIDPSVGTINIDSGTIEALLDPAIQSVMNSSLNGLFEQLL